MSPSIMSALSATYRSRQRVLGYPVDLVDQAGALEIIETAWRSDKGLQVETLNAEMVVAAQQDQRLDRIIRHAHLIVPDGAGVIWALRMAGHSIDRLPGIELASAALTSAAAKGVNVALVGGRPEVIDVLRNSLPRLHPGLKLVATKDGYFPLELEEDVVDAIAAQEPRLILVALGVPKQEYFVDQWREKFPRAVMLGVGGSFDVWAGIVKRAPKSFQKLHLEWFYRLMKEPWRFKRMSSSLPSFGLQVLSERIKSIFRPSKRKSDRNR